MAIPLRQLISVQQSRARRLELGRYITLDRGRSYIAVAILCALMGFALIAQFTRVAQVGLEISTLRGTQAELEMQQKDLQLRIAEAQSNRRIQKYINESGMVPALKVDVVYLSIQPTATDIPVEVIP